MLLALAPSDTPYHTSDGGASWQAVLTTGLPNLMRAELVYDAHIEVNRGLCDGKGPEARDARIHRLFLSIEKGTS